MQQKEPRRWPTNPQQLGERYGIDSPSQSSEGTKRAVTLTSDFSLLKRDNKFWLLGTQSMVLCVAMAHSHGLQMLLGAQLGPLTQCLGITFPYDLSFLQYGVQVVRMNLQEETS